ncbi:hypothetical protein [Ornithinibacillus bavariensis]|uniref:AP2/ERF domain-containing protein n=1 Tax=Ornithinibacillus bavariensis TaxID=545502 RepID=A0A919X7N8_9BACI|nr:hypothetical protein [Ornithinibacillus bavariensis]GIO26378.1 hypothetical protein J43TS3_09890 [Ornithinibacillus bavariensis]
MTNPKDYTGDKYGRLTLIKEVEPYIPPSRSYKARRYLCKCDCGNEIEAVLNAIRSGNTRSCGCVSREKTIKRNKESSKYGEYKNHSHFSRWRGMIERCYYPNHRDYHRYGGRGIEVCSEWRNHPRKFINWIETESNWKDGENLTLDRIDYYGNYEPSNCIFSDYSKQSLNRGVFSSNTSGYPGVSRHGDRWRSRITVNGKRIHLGVYDTKEEAIKSRMENELKYFGRVRAEINKLL